MKRYLLLLMGVWIMCACGKYDEGPSFSLRSKKDRLVNTWKVESIYLNGSQLQFFAPIAIIETYKNDGTYSVQEYSTTINGTWTFRQGGLRLERSAGSESDIIEIDKLSGNAFWYSYSAGPDRYQYRLVPN